MSKMIQIRNVPDELHRKLKAKAASMGKTLSGYLLSEIEEIAAKPTLKEWLEMVKRVQKPTGGESLAPIIRELRDSMGDDVLFGGRERPGKTTRRKLQSKA